ncbi:Xanthine/uracil permease, partial [Aureobasidium melanogenum]
MIRRPLVATEANRNVVMPPSTAEGMATRAAANLLKIPMMSSQKQAANPAFRLAHRVKAIFFVSSLTPSTHRAEQPARSVKIARGDQTCNQSVQSVSKDTTLDAAVERSSVDLEARYITSRNQWTVDLQLESANPDEVGDRCSINTAAVEVSACSGYDTSYEQTDNNSTRLHNRAAKALGQDDADKDKESKSDELCTSPRKGVRCIDSEQLPLPPAQSWKPELINDTPISITVGPVTMGGKIFFKIFGGVKLIRISRRAQTHEVAISAPYPSGHGRWLPFASDGQKPVAYICEKAPVATGMVAKDVPTTDINPVPT